MSAMNISRNGNTITFSGDMTKDFNQMRREMSGRFNMWVGDVTKAIPKLGDKLTTDQLMTLHKEGTHAEFYENNNILGYFCIDPKDYSNYMFLIGDGENRDNNYSRLRNGVLQFSIEAYCDIYILH